MFLHLLRLDRKFAKPWVDEWESVEPNNHIYVQHSRSLVPKDTTAGIPVVTNVDEFHKIVPNFSNVDGVVLSGHSTASYFCEIIKAIPHEIPICLVSWGGVREPEYFEETKKYFHRQALIGRLASVGRPRIFVAKARSFLKKKFGRKKVGVDQAVLDFYNRIDIFASSTSNEFEDFVKFPGVKKSVVYSYGTVGTPIPTRIKLCSGNAVQVGNSGLELNNHLDLFETIKPILPKGTKVIVPLTYYLNKDYADYVIRQGVRLFGEDFVPLTKHLPYAEYVDFLNQIGFYISGQTTSMGLGNLHLALRRGAKVFVPRSCPMYAEYRNLGIPIFSLEDDLQGNPNAFTEFTEEEKLHCQNKLYENLNAERSLEGCRNILALLRKIRAERANDPRFN